MADTVRRQSDEGSQPIPDPCLPKNLTLDESTDDSETSVLVGTGSFEQCVQQVAPLLNKDAPCPDVPCLFNGVHVPNIDFSVSRFIGVSEYWYSSEHVFGLGGAYNVAEYERAASQFCSRDWEDILRQHRLSKDRNALGGDGEVEVDGKIVDLGQWGDKVEIPRLQMQCFKSAWLVNVLHDGIGMPRIVDPGGNPAVDAGEIENKAKQKGLGKPLLQSVDVIRDTAISWTLGKMVLEASREVPPLSDDVAPISDPSPDGRKCFTWGRPMSPRLMTMKTMWPTSRTNKYSFEFTLSNILLLVVWLLVFVTLACRLRRPASKLFRRLFRRTFKNGTMDGIDQTLLEEGEYPSGSPRSIGPSPSRFFLLSSSSLPLPPMRSYLSRIVSSFRSSAQSSSTFCCAPHAHTFCARPLLSLFLIAFAEGYERDRSKRAEFNERHTDLGHPKVRRLLFVRKMGRW